MADEWTPEPEPAGDREPPRRRPPTAVGVLTPPPPHRPRRSVYRSSRLRQRLAYAFVGASGAFVGIVTASLASHPAAVALGSVLALLGARFLGVSLRGIPRPPELGVVADRNAVRRRAA